MLAVSMAAEIKMAQDAERQTAACTRAEVEEATRGNRLETTRQDFVCQLQATYVTLNRPEAMLPAHAIQIRNRCDEVLAGLQRAANERDLRRTAIAIPELLLDLDHAVRNRLWHDQAQAGTQHAAAQQTRIADLEQTFASLPDAPLDPAGREEVRRALQAARLSVSAGEVLAEALVMEAAEALLKYQRGVAYARAIQESLRAHAEQAAAELHALLMGLRSDATVMRWHARSVEEITLECERIACSESPDALLAEARSRCATILEEANAAELKARQRDYIADGIARSLQEMGFVVTPPTEEHRGHPATARLLHAASAAGKEIAVSVPVEGSIWYEVNGYPRSTEATVDGGTAVACDEAERVLTEMHALLNEAFEVKAGAIHWQGKAPKRKLRRAASLPEGANEETSRSSS